MKKFLVGLFISAILIACNNEKPAEQKDESSAVPVPEAKMQPVEFADPKYMEMGKNALAALSKGDVAGWMNGYADNAVFQWNNLDSAVGKAAITDYWTKRRTESIDSITFTNMIFLPVKVNQPQSIEQPGVWLLGWYTVNAKYKKTGKRMIQLLHTDIHFNSSDQIDRVIMYIDRVPVNAAMK
ncbi:nuclear transport factor 2 family protein [Flavihumibacter fluvii]|uniref:nuclear transport factor 2 family protein n=1 Tax=Flavihumibacter fluvii TaxID=2838157 RepID=UPI001BDE2BFC|nr:nuclear transport factor 2 family protein [Flavihumibacter fluvii]ULQ54637.1 nuclear transport factor 2 family protein [Flavihumibacter fluvii]